MWLSKTSFSKLSRVFSYLLVAMNVACLSQPSELDRELMFAILSDKQIDLRKIEDLLNQGAKVNATIYGEKPVIWPGQQPLHLAVDRANLDLIKLLVNKGAEINCRDGYQRTPLMYAIESGNDEIIKFLVQSGADVDAISIYHNNVASVLSACADSTMREFLVGRGATLSGRPTLMQDLQLLSKQLRGHKISYPN